MAVLDKIVFDAKVSDRKILLIPVDTIIAANYNPKSRTAEGAELRKLIELVRKYGVLQPILITEDRDLVDGHRRLAAAKAVGMAYVECIILPTHVDKDEIFGPINVSSVKITNRGWLEACRLGCKKPPADIAAQYAELSGLVGMYGVDLLIEKKIGLSILKLCKEFKAYGLVIRLDSLIIKVAQGKLSNKLNMICRSDLDREQKVRQMESLLA